MTSTEASVVPLMRSRLTSFQGPPAFGRGVGLGGGGGRCGRLDFWPGRPPPPPPEPKSKLGNPSKPPLPPPPSPPLGCPKGFRRSDSGFGPLPDFSSTHASHCCNLLESDRTSWAIWTSSIRFSHSSLGFVRPQRSGCHLSAAFLNAFFKTSALGNCRPGGNSRTRNGLKSPLKRKGFASVYAPRAKRLRQAPSSTTRMKIAKRGPKPHPKSVRILDTRYLICRRSRCSLQQRRKADKCA
mmetsp:Transcript_71435/g.180601  ORF Transcript_71435/g.180601 Transcript_71435/m.180601 type:complete len:240 (+) Transcript_71435:196-915(+)